MHFSKIAEYIFQQTDNFSKATVASYFFPGRSFKCRGLFQTVIFLLLDFRAWQTVITTIIYIILMAANSYLALTLFLALF